jgi:membrane fusion protein (multidrug efflux system)
MRYLLAIAGLVLVIGGLAYVKAAQIKQLIGFGQAMEKSGPPPESVGSSVAKEQSWEGSLGSVGTVAPVKGVAISNDAPGVVTKISFESGAVVKPGAVLVELDSAVERAQMAQAEVRRDLAQKTLKRTRELVASGALPQAQLDADQSQLSAAEADLGLLQAQVARKIVRAPFAGRLGIRTVNVGQYLNPGTPLTTLEAADAVYVDFTLPQQEAAAVGMKVRVGVEGTGEKEREGTISAIDPSVDSVSRTTRLRATVPNGDDKLRPGMFVKVFVLLPKQESFVTVPQTSVVHASYGDSVFVLEDPPDGEGGDGPKIKIARQQFVRTGEARGDFIAILDGVKVDQEVVSAGAFKLRNKARVVVNNDGNPSPALSPTPENH